MGEYNAYQFPWARYPGIRIAVLFAAGITWQYFISADLALLQILFLGVSAIWIFTDLKHNTRINLNSSKMAIMTYLSVIFLFGGIRYAGYDKQVMHQKTSAEHLLLFAWEEINFEGKIVNRFTTSSGREAYDIKVFRTYLDSKIWNYEYIIRVYGNEDQERWNNYIPGESIRALVRIFELEEPVNPGLFNYKAFLHRLGIYVHGELIEGTSTVEKPNRYTWTNIRLAVHERIENLFDESTVPLAKALLTGYKQELDREDQQYFARAGLSHIMAVSGMHVGFIVAPFWLLIPWLWQYRYGGWFGLLLLSIVLIFYAGLTGFSPSVSRASLMAWLLTAGRLFKKMKDSINLMGVSAFILLLINPSQLFEIGFQLSFGAVIVILLLMPLAREIIPQRYLETKRGKLAMVMMISFVVQIGLYPLLVWYFGEFSIIGPVANALVVPVLSFVVPMSFVLMPFTEITPSITVSVLNAPNAYALKWIAYIAELLGGWHRSWITAEITSVWFFLFWIMAIGFFATLKIPVLRNRFMILALITYAMISIYNFVDSRKVSELKVVMLDVGQGDAIHVETPGGRHLMIDTGRWSPMNNSGEKVIIPYLEANGIQKLDAVILSHPHADHIGGIPALIDHVEIERIYYCGYDYDSVLYQTYQQMAYQSDIRLQPVRKGDLLPIDESIRVFVLGPDGNIHNSNPNDHSVVVKVVYNETHFLFTGDAEKHQESRIRKVYGDFLKSDFLKVGHHGSRTSSHSGFLQDVQPDIAAVSLSFKNMFNHPHPEAVKRLYSYTDQIYFTSLEGALIFKSNGQNISFSLNYN